MVVSRRIPSLSPIGSPPTFARVTKTVLPWLIGLVAAGSSPVACVGLVALLLVVRIVTLKLSVATIKKRREQAMGKTRRLMSLVVSGLETVWAIGTSYVAGALPA